MRMNGDRIRIDGRCGFPMIPSSDNVWIGLWPVTKVQFEAFIADGGWCGSRPGVKSDGIYAEMLTLNPRRSHLFFGSHDYERLFVGGVLPDEIGEFCAWMGEGYGIPTVKEWREFYLSVLDNPRIYPPYTPRPPDLAGIPAAIWERNAGLHPEPLRFCLLHGGLVEWAARSAEDPRPVGIAARPRGSFHRNAWQAMQIIEPEVRRLHFFGFRLIRRGLPP
jgi:hypothetical protein